VLRGVNIAVRTLVVAVQHWGLTADQIADEYGISPTQVEQALAFYQQHRQEVDLDIATDRALEAEHA
jgi:uncharacterized protein (DUF433 family)